MGKLINAFRKYTSPEIPDEEILRKAGGESAVKIVKSMTPRKSWIPLVSVMVVVILLMGILTFVFAASEAPTTADPLPTPTPIAAEGTPVPENVLEEQFPAVYGIFNTLPYLMVIVVAGAMAMALMRVMRT